MRMDMFSVFDRAVKAYLPPFFARSSGEALRSFTEAVNNKEHQFFKHTADYSLWRLGQWNDEDGSVLPIEPERVITAMECLIEDNVFPLEKKIG